MTNSLIRFISCLNNISENDAGNHTFAMPCAAPPANQQADRRILAIHKDDTKPKTSVYINQQL